MTLNNNQSTTFWCILHLFDLLYIGIYLLSLLFLYDTTTDFIFIRWISIFVGFDGVVKQRKWQELWKAYVTREVMSKYQNHEFKCQGKSLYLFMHESWYKYRLIHGHFHIGLVIIPRPPYMGRGMITRPIWKCQCIKLFITFFRHLEKRHPYWPETKSRPILAREIWASIWKWSCSNPITVIFPGVKIWTVYFRSYWSYKNAFIWTKYVINENTLCHSGWVQNNDTYHWTF